MATDPGSYKTSSQENIRVSWDEERESRPADETSEDLRTDGWGTAVAVPATATTSNHLRGQRFLREIVKSSA